MSLTSSTIKPQPSTPTPDLSEIPAHQRFLGSIETSTTDRDETLNHASLVVDPQLFTFLPEIYLILSRLAPLRNGPPSQIVPANLGNGLPDTNHDLSSAAVPMTTDSTTNTLTRIGSRNSVSSHFSGATNLTTLTAVESNSTSTVEVKDLPAHLYPVIQRIKSVTEIVKGLPDVSRGLEEQEGEIKMLERRIGALRERRRQLGQIGLS